MVANGLNRETDLVDAAISWLGDRVPSAWAVERGARAAEPRNGVEASVDAFIELRAPNGVYTTLAAEARDVMEPRDVDQLLPGLARSLRAIAGNIPLLVVAPWLSGRTQDRLAAENINFLDMTGNALVKLDNPAVFIQATGAARNPNPPARGPASIRGPKAARLVRLLADVRPPYGVRDLANAARLTAGYVSRLLDALDRDALVQRGRRGVVEDVDVAALLRAWAREYDVFKREVTSSFVAPKGAGSALAQLASVQTQTLVTGSFAAVRLAPIAAPSMLVAVAPRGGRRGARLGVHGRRAARRAIGLEAALVDHSPMTIAALASTDRRSVTANVAGAAALLVAKAHKIHDRLEVGRLDRLVDKDAADVLRLMQTTAPSTVGATLAGLTAHPMAGEVTTAGVGYLEAQFGRRAGPGVEMAARAMRLAIPADRVQAICTGYISALVAAVR